MKTKKEKIAYGIVVLFFVFVQLICRTLELNGNMVWNAKSISICFGISILSVVIFFFAVSFIKKIRNAFYDKKENRSDNTIKVSSGKIFFASWIIIFICWIPLFLAYYPGILAYDSGVQIGQIVQGAYNNHHPLIHTLMIAVFMKIGELLGSVNMGVAIYTLVQMLCLSSTMSVGIYFLEKKGVKRYWLWLIIMYCGLCPSNSYMAISMTKDVFFTIFVLLFVFILLYLLEGKKHHFMWDVAYVLVATLMMLFRNNGKYAILVFLIFLFLSLLVDFGGDRQKKKNADKEEVKQKRKEILLILSETVAGVILSSVLLSGLNNIVSSQEGDKREMLSIPIQQIARCMVYHGGFDIVEMGDDTISEADKKLIDEFILHNGYLQYEPSISDPVKRCTNTSIVLNKFKEFISMYVRLIFDYPEECINAFLEVNGGYLSILDESHSKVNLRENLLGLGYLQTRWEENAFGQLGIYKDSKLPKLYTLLEKFAGENVYLDIPIVRTLVAPGMYIWCYIILGIWAFFHREKKYQFILFFVVGYYVTLLLGPTVQLRYLYPVMLLLPFVYLYVLYGERSRM